MFNSDSVATVCRSVLHKGHVLGEVTFFFLALLLLSSPLSLLPLTRPYFLLDLWLCQLFLPSFLFSLSLFLALTLSPLLPSLTFTFLSKLCLLCFCLFLPPRPEPPHHSPHFSVVPPGGCGFVPPSSSPFWSGTGTALLLSLSLPCCLPTFSHFQSLPVLSPLSLLNNVARHCHFCVNFTWTALIRSPPKISRISDCYDSLFLAEVKGPMLRKIHLTNVFRQKNMCL